MNHELSPGQGWRINNGGTCQDCLSDAVVTRSPLGLLRITIIHSRGCPWYAARARRIERFRAARAAIARAVGGAR